MFGGGPTLPPPPPPAPPPPLSPPPRPCRPPLEVLQYRPMESTVLDPRDFPQLMAFAAGPPPSLHTTADLGQQEGPGQGQGPGGSGWEPQMRRYRPMGVQGAGADGREGWVGGREGCVDGREGRVRAVWMVGRAGWMLGSRGAR